MATSTYDIKPAELLIWGASIKEAAQAAWNGDGEFVAGEHCMWCRIKGKCKARAEQNMALAKKYEERKAAQLTMTEIADLLPHLTALAKWAGDVQEYALEQARDHGARVPGYKLVEGRSNRTYSDKALVLQTLIQRKFKPEEVCKPAELLGITEMEAKLGKKTFTELLGDLISKPSGKPTLVPATDKREELNSSVATDADFDGV